MAVAASESFGHPAANPSCGLAFDGAFPPNEQGNPATQAKEIKSEKEKKVLACVCAFVLESVVVLVSACVFVAVRRCASKQEAAALTLEVAECQQLWHDGSLVQSVFASATFLFGNIISAPPPFFFFGVLFWRR